LVGADAGGAASGVLAPLGRAVLAGNGYAIDGRWPFTSGCLHATWTLTGVLVMDGAAPRMVPGRGPDWRLAVLPAADVEIHDTWDSRGLRGTGSHDVPVHKQIPAEHLADPFHNLAPHDGPLWRIPFFTQLAFGRTGFALGVARRALDDFTRLASTKRRGPTLHPVAESGDAQLALARAEGGLQAVRAFAVDALGALWSAACRGDVPAVDLRGRVLLAALNAERAAVAAVDSVFPYAGSSGVYSSEPLQRCFRDLHNAGQHIYVGADAWKRYAKLVLGIDGPTFQI
jgi:indole-3-acetate monooxygenase